MTIPLSAAYLCANCSVVGDNSHTCPACGDNSALLSLASVLDRETINEDSADAVRGAYAFHIATSA